MENIDSLIKLGIQATVVLAIGLPVLRMIRKGQISSLGISKDGAKLEMNKIEKRDETRYYRDRRIAEVDAWLDLAAREITRDRKKVIQRFIAGSTICGPATRAVTSDLLYTLYDAVNRNDFKHNLSLKVRSSYKSEKMDAIEAEYSDFNDSVSVSPCSDKSDPTVMPTWAILSPKLDKMLDGWMDDTRDKVIEACKKKIAIYSEYKDGYEGNELKIVENCIAKNEEYIKNLGGEL